MSKVKNFLQKSPEKIYKRLQKTPKHIMKREAIRITKAFLKNAKRLIRETEAGTLEKHRRKALIVFKFQLESWKNSMRWEKPDDKLSGMMAIALLNDIVEALEQRKYGKELLADAQKLRDFYEKCLEEFKKE